MNSNDLSKYQDILELPHPVSTKHPQMPLMNRAAQFMPFAALTGYDVAIEETARRTDDRMELEEDTRESINMELERIASGLIKEAQITYFQPDQLKDGGSYLTLSGEIKKVDPYEREIILQDGQKVRIDDIIDIQEI